MKDLLICFKLIPYGKKAKLNMICGIVCIALGLISYIGLLFSSSDFSESYFPAFLLFEGMIFITQPAMTIAQRGGLAFSPIRKTAEIYYQPLCIFLTATAANIIWSLTGCLASMSSPNAAHTAAFTMFMGVIFCIVFASAVTMTKMNLAFYILGIVILSAVMIGSQNWAAALIESIFAQENSLTVIFLSAGVCEIGCLIVSLISLLVCKCFYKKNYSKFTKQLTDVY